MHCKPDVLSKKCKIPRSSLTLYKLTKHLPPHSGFGID